MKILFVTHFFPPTHTAGTENYTLGLAKKFLSLGHKVEVICAADWQSGKHYWNGVSTDIYSDLPVHRLHLNWLKHQNPNQVLYDSPQIEMWVDEFLAARQFDLVHVTSLITLGVGILRSVKRAQIPLVLTLMDFWFLCPSIQLLKSDGNLCDGQTTAWECQSCLLSNSNLYHAINRLAIPENTQSKTFQILSNFPSISKQRGFRGMLLNMQERKTLLTNALQLPDRILTHSDTVQKYIQLNTAADIEVLRFGYAPTWTGDPLPENSSASIRFGYVGQLLPIKGVDILIRAFKEINPNLPAQLEIWGDLNANPAYVAKLRSLISDDPRIQLCGRFQQDKLRNVFANIDVLIVPSIWYENSPLVIKEAFSLRTPVIATNIGGMAEAIRNDFNGLLFERNNPDDLARQIRRICTEPGLLPRLIDGINPVKHIDEEVDELIEIYNDLIHAYGSIPT